MNSKTLKKQRELKQKLMAATSMLLVSALMVVTSTYAWFTLSTAPEVTGITTAVGANGNLEMALQPYSGDLTKIVSSESDSLKLPLERNITWGNLVDVSDNASYGMNNLVLYPAKLNVADEKIGVNPLSTPVYGADGRVSEVRANTLTGAYDYIKGQFAESMTIGEASYTNAKGVRAIGVSSSMTARELAHRNAMSAAISNGSGANVDAGKSLNNNGAAIANIAVKHALATEAETYTADEIAPLKVAVTDLQKIAGRIEIVLKNYLLANSIAGSDAEATYVDLVANIDKAVDLDAAEAVANVKVPTDSAYTTAKEKLASMKTAIESASAILDLSGNAITWEDLSTPLNALVNTADITVMGMTIEQVNTNKEALISAVMGNNYTAELVLPTGSGVYADIADFTGNYSAAFSMNVSYGSLQNIPVNAEMYAQTNLTANNGTTYLDGVKAITATFSSGDSNASTAQPITTFYGYIIDLAFRTNAAGSYLQLQADAVDRIYNEDGNNPETMGGGANMTFKTDSSTFGQAGVKALMENIRVIFFDTQSNDILAYAKLDSSSAANSDTNITMPLMLTDSTFRNAKTDDAATADIDESVQIMALTQNTAHALSVMVYLDGTTMGNDDVAADAANSMYGSMNLQFSSSATLKPMDYADLKTEGASTTTSYTALNNVGAPNGYGVRAYTDGKNIGFALTAPTGTSLDSATVKASIAGGEAITATSGTFAGQTGYVVSIPTDVTVDANTAITITVEGATGAEPTPEVPDASGDAT